jgi:hypothetical protein
MLTSAHPRNICQKIGYEGLNIRKSVRFLSVTLMPVITLTSFIVAAHHAGAIR